MFKRVQVVGFSLTTKHCGPVVAELSSQPWQSIDVVDVYLETGGQQDAGSLNTVVQDRVDKPVSTGTKV